MLKQQQSEEQVEHTDPQSVLWKDPQGEKSKAYSFSSQRNRNMGGKKCRQKRQKKKVVVSLTKFLPDLPNTRANELRSPTNLGDSDGPVFLMLLHLPCGLSTATGGPRVAWESLCPWLGDPSR